ncbi:hypothetical protein [Niastella populi]|uniref:CHAT domain-containing protein n=1 Tax=Niastella populi TaxID=550983 RepID=A0A1V9G4Y6_9BACT|nr:hypothetical protein [Niastella populi]OQP65568.1 hypothetical protein A4R26_33655 [Niastella populi]
MFTKNDDKRYFRFNAVYVIESLNNYELQTGEVLYNDILRYMPYKIEIIKCRLFKVNSKVELVNTFNELKEDFHSHGTHPFLHFEIHGAKEGLVLNSGELIKWREIASLLRELNIMTGNNIMVSLATCYGAYIYGSILPSLPAPFFAFIGPWNTVTSDEIMVSFTRFFEFIFAAESLKDIDLDLAAEKLNEENDVTEKFGFHLSEAVFDRVVNQIEEKLKDPNEFKKRVENLVEEGLKIESIRNSFTREELKKASEDYLRSPSSVRDRMKNDFLMRG